jgi:hypothetical protein
LFVSLNVLVPRRANVLGLFPCSKQKQCHLVAVFVPAPRHLIQALAEAALAKAAFVVFFFVRRPTFTASYPDIHLLLLDKRVGTPSCIL